MSRILPVEVAYRYDAGKRVLRLRDLGDDAEMGFDLSPLEEASRLHVAELVCQAYQAGYARAVRTLADDDEVTP